MQNILFIGDANSIHNLKWIELLAENENFQIFFLPSSIIKQEISDIYINKRLKKIIFLNPLYDFTLLRFNKFISGIFYLNKIIRKNNINLVHVSFVAPNALWTLFIKNKKIKTVLRFYGSDLLVVIPELLNGKGFKGWYNHLLWKLFKKSFIKADAITCTSHFLKTKFIEMTHRQDKVYVVRTGVNIQPQVKIPDNFLNDLPDNRKIIFSPRFMSKIYDIELQVDAIALLPDDIIQKCCFIFINTKPTEYSEMIKRKLDKLVVEKTLIYKILPLISQEEMFYIYRISSLVIMTPVSDGTPNSALETFVAKKPLIISDLINYDDDLFKDTCIKLKIRTPHELARLITETLNNYPSEMIEKAFEQVQKYGNLNLEVEKLNNIYNSLLN